jgi:hypothetical protein
VLVSRATLKAVGREIHLGEPRTTQLKGFDNSIELVPIIWGPNSQTPQSTHRRS